MWEMSMGSDMCEVTLIQTMGVTIYAFNFHIDVS